MLSTLPTRPRLLSAELVTAPTVPVLTTTEAQTHLNLATGAADTYLDALVTAATRRVENICRRSLITQTWRVTYRASALPLRLIRPPVIALTAVSTSFEGTTTNEASLSGFYVLPGNRPELRFTDAGAFTASEIETVTITYTAGYGSASSAVPEALREAVRYALTTLYDRRDEAGATEAATGVQVEGVPLPGIVHSLCGPYIIHTV